MNVLNSILFDEVCHRRSLRAADVAALQELYNANTAISQTEIAALLTINRVCVVQDTTWGPFLADAIADFVVAELDPCGYVTADNAQWLISAVANNGRITSAGLRNAVTRTIERARWAPPTLFVFLARSILIRLGRYHRLTPTGAATDLSAGEAPPMDRQEIDDVVRAVAGFSKAAPMVISYNGLQHLIALDASRGEAGGDRWDRMIETVIALAALGASGYQLPDREAAFAGLFKSESRPWFVEPLKAMTPHAQELAELERQRFEILTGESLSALKGEQMVRLLDGGDRRLLAPLDQLVKAGYEVAPAISHLIGRHRTAA